MLSLRRLTGLVLICMLSACSSPKGSDQKSLPPSGSSSDGPKAPQDQPLYSSLFQIDFIPEDSPNQYLMRMSWPQGLGPLSLRYGQGEHFIPVVELKDEHQFSARIQGAVPVKIEVHSLAGTASLAFSVNPPADLEVKSQIVLTKNSYWTYRRVYFYSQGTILTNGFDLTVDAKEIHVSRELTAASDLFQILTFPQEGAHHIRNRKEYDGSNVVVRSDSADGVLRVGMFGVRGENGRDGKVIAPVPALPDPSLNGLDGAPAIVEVRNGDNKICRRRAGNGQNGKRGATGHAGEDGRNGGDTGNLAVIIPHNDELQLEIVARPGKGGRGGEGAPGGPGGTAGRAGTPDKYNFCIKGHDGRPGPRGYSGPDGADGKSGKMGTFEYSSIKHVRME